MDQPPQQFSLTGAGVTLAGQFIVLPADWEPTVRAAVAFAVSVAVGVMAPIARDFLRELAVDVTGRRRAEAERDAVRRELAEQTAELDRLRSGQTLLGPPRQMPQQSQSVQSRTPEK